MRRSRSLASSYCSASARDNSDWDVWAFKAKLRRRSGTRCLGLEVSTVKREAFLLVTAICTRACQDINELAIAVVMAGQASADLRQRQRQIPVAERIAVAQRAGLLAQHRP